MTSSLDLSVGNRHGPVMTWHRCLFLEGNDPSQNATISSAAAVLDLTAFQVRQPLPKDDERLDGDRHGALLALAASNYLVDDECGSREAQQARAN